MRHAVGGLLGIFVVVAACASPHEERVEVRVSPSLVFPRGVLDEVKKLTVTVFDPSGTVSCDAATGIATSDAADKPIATKDLLGTGCTPGVKFCGELSIDKSEKDRVFLAQGTSGDKVVATGCATAKVNQDALPLTIKMVRFITPAVCGNGAVEATEQCEGDAEVCDAECRSVELRLSVGSAAANTSTGSAGDKRDPFFLWPNLGGDAGRLLALFTDKTSGTDDVALAVMSETMKKGDLKAATNPVILRTSSINLTNKNSVFPSQPAPFAQGAASAVLSGTNYVIVFEDDDSGNGRDIHFRTVDPQFVLLSTAATGVNGPGGAGKLGIQSAPTIAVNAGKLLVAWQDDSPTDNGKIYVRSLTEAGTVGAETEVSSGTGNKQAGLAPIAGGGFVCVWESAGDIKLRPLKADGTPDGAEVTVNESTAGVQERPRVAGLGDGRYAVVWADKSSGNSDIFFQRCDASGKKVAGDQGAPLNDVVKDGDQVTPAIAGLPAKTGSYAVAWLDGSSNHVRGRFVGGSGGFLFNNVTGQATEFRASAVDGRVRGNPVVAAGGSGPFVAFGWEDRTNGGSPGPGVIARRFPAP